MIQKIIQLFKTEGLHGLFVRLGNRVTLIHSIRQKIGKSYILSSYGVLMKKNWLDATYRLCITGAYGNFFSDFIKYQAKPFIFLDIGANQGLYTLIAEKNPNCIKAIPFEPVQSTFNLLKENISINNADQKCYPVQKGVGEDPQFLSITIPENHSGGASIASQFKNVNKEYREETIEIISSEYLDAIKMPDRQYSIVCKIDVEGQEVGVIKALIGSIIFSNINSIFYEVDEDWVDPIEIENLLKAEGIKKFQQIGSGKHYDVLASRT